MIIPCPYNAPCIDDANSLGNFSSEDPDRELFRSTYFQNQIWDGAQDVWTACFGLCVSVISQEEADLCAQNNAKICERNKQFGNEVYTCYKVCPDGTTYSFTVPAGTFWSTESQAQANALAHDWCDDYITALCESIPGPGNPNPGPTPNPRLPPSTQKDCNDAMDIYLICPDGRRGWNVPACRVWAGDKFAANVRARTIAEDYITWAIGCLTELPKTACVGDEWNRFVAPSTVAGVRRPVGWEVFGIPPPGINFAQQIYTMRVHGTFTVAGTYGFRLTMTDDRGLYSYRVYFISVMEIDEPRVMPQGETTTPYSNTISVLGGWDPKTFGLKAGDTLPDGLTLDAATGVISGTPTTVQTKTFTIIVEDAEGGTCEKEFELEIVSSIFALWTWGTSESIIGCAGGHASGSGASGSLSATLPSSGSVCGNATTRAQHAVWSIDNTGGPAINAQLQVVVGKVNPVPPGSNGIQSGSETIFFERLAPAPVVIANTGSAQVPAGTYTYPFTIPAGVISTYGGLFICQASYAGPVPPPNYAGGSSTFSITFSIP